MNASRVLLCISALAAAFVLGLLAARGGWM